MGQTEPAPKEPQTAAQPARKRTYLEQADVPSFPLSDALRVSDVIAEQYGKQPTAPTDVALALDLLPKGSQFKVLTGSSIAYGLTEGGAQAETISLTELGLRVVSPTEEGDDVAAMREALLRPRVPREFLERYDGSTLPTDERIARNVLESLGVPAARTAATFELIVGTAESLGLLGEVRGKKVVNLRPATTALRAVPPLAERHEDKLDPEAGDSDADVMGGTTPFEDSSETSVVSRITPEPETRRVFISHGSDRTIVAALKQMLEYGEFEPVVSVEQ